MTDKPIRVLIVDDDSTLLDMYRTRLVAENFIVETGTDGQDALSKALEFAPNAILLDLRMPHVSGLEALEILKTTKKTKDIPVVVLTALGDDSIRTQAMARGAADYMVKADTMPADIVKKIHAVVSEQ